MSPVPCAGARDASLSPDIISIVTVPGTDDVQPNYS